MVPFSMRSVGPPGLNWVPWLSAFPEINVRTYVRCEGKPGVFFLSLDAANWLAVLGARIGFGLPYFWAQITSRRTASGAVDYRSTRLLGGHARFRGSYGPTGESYRAAPNTFEHWLVERYCLYSLHRGRLCRGEVHHAPWDLHKAYCEDLDHSMTAWAGIELPDCEPVLHFVHSIDVLAWLLETTGSKREEGLKETHVDRVRKTVSV
ncbi:MAG: DUF2071 domain-containing protein [Myxococcota bacterium]